MISKVISRINNCEKVLIITHENPDGDALGSSLALAKSLKQIEKNVDIVCIDDIPLAFQFLPEIKYIKKDFLFGDYDIAIILDCGDLKRTGFPERLREIKLKDRKKIINIDHHPKNDLHKIANINLIDYNSSSTSEIIYEIIQQIEQIEINKEIATCLLCGLYTDTGAFKHSNTTPKVLKISAELLKCGARLKKITESITNGKSISALKLWGIVFSRIQKNEEFKIISSFIREKDLVDCHATHHDLSGVVNMINSIPNTNVAILFSEIGDGKIKASIRTEKDNVDASRLAEIFGGGGLKKASGFTIDGKLICKNNIWDIE